MSAYTTPPRQKLKNQIIRANLAGVEQSLHSMNHAPNSAVKTADYMLSTVGTYDPSITDSTKKRIVLINETVRKKRSFANKIKGFFSLGEGGRRKTLRRRRGRKQTRKGKKKILIPPILVEATVNAAELLVGGARKHMRKY